MKFGTIRKPLLLCCLTASVALHVGAVWFLYAHPVSIVETEQAMLMKPSLLPQVLPKEEEELLVEKIEKALEDSLNKVVALAKLPQANNDSIAAAKTDEETSSINNESTKKAFTPTPKVNREEWERLECAESSFATSMPPLFDPEIGPFLDEFALDEEKQEELFDYESEKIASVDFTDHRLYRGTAVAVQAMEDDYTITDDQFSPSTLPMGQAKVLSPHFMAALKKIKTPQEKSDEIEEGKMFTQLAESTDPKLVLPNSVDYLQSQWIKRSLAERQLPNFDYYGLEAITSHLEWEENIDVDISLMADPNSNKYIFSLTIHPSFEADCQSMRQNFYFLIDRSSSIEKHKFSCFKRAVQRSMSALREGDNFNILIFDKQISKLSDHPLAVTPHAIQMATDFLEKENAKSHFAAEDLYTILGKMLPTDLNPKEMHSVILITDGNTLLNGEKQRKTIGGWIKKFEGNVNFYTASAGKGNNLVLLDLLSYTSGGKTLYSDTNAAFPRKLVHLVKELHDPIVKNVTIEISANDSNAQVSLYPQTQLLPPMFIGQPYVVVGTIDELCDITLFIQGKNQDKWLNIRKKISLAGNTTGGRSLEKLWAHVQSKICYEHFLKNGKNSHLKEAKELVAPYNGIISLE